MTRHDPRDILDWLWDRDLIEACCVYDHRSRWRDAYHGSPHKACIAHAGYYYCVDDQGPSRGVIVPENGFVLTCGYAARDAFAEHPELIDELARTIGARRIERMPEDADVYVITF